MAQLELICDNCNKKIKLPETIKSAVDAVEFACNEYDCFFGGVNIHFFCSDCRYKAVEYGWVDK